MSNHTPEPWPPFIDVCEPATPHPDSNEIVCLGFDDYRRARTCVNACRGLSTDELEQHGLVSAVGTELMELEKQRDELLSLVEEFATEMQECYDWPDTSSSQEKLARIAEKARNYTGKDKGGAS